MIKTKKNDNLIKIFIIQAVAFLTILFKDEIITALFLIFKNLFNLKESLFLTVYPIFLGLLIIFAVFAFKDDFKFAVDDFKNNFKDRTKLGFKYWGAGLLLMMLSNALISLFLTGGKIAENEQSVRVLIEAVPFFAIPMAILFAPILEEIAYRLGIRKLIKNDKFFVICSALFFGLAHVSTQATSLVSFTYIIPYSVLGYYFAKLLVETKNILVSISFHILHNSLVLGLIFLLNTLQP